MRPLQPNPSRVSANLKAATLVAACQRTKESYDQESRTSKVHNNSQIAEQSSRELGLAGRRAGALRAASRGCAHARTLRAQRAQGRPGSGWCSARKRRSCLHISWTGFTHVTRDFSVQTGAPALEWTRRNMGEVAIFLLLSTSAHFLPWQASVAPRSRNFEFGTNKLGILVYINFESWKKSGRVKIFRWFWINFILTESLPGRNIAPL